jgi:hypothetical protein
MVNENVKNKLCVKDHLTFEDCEMAILRLAIKENAKVDAEKVLKNPNFNKMLSILTNFIRRKKLVCYGGIAINAVLPDEDKIYSTETDIPDYDFFSSNALDDAKELADIYYKEGFQNIEAKSGVHVGTFKLFVDYVAMADISYMPVPLFNMLQKQAVNVDGILYTDPNYLKMAMALELSNSAGDVTRWEKVFKRYKLIEKYYPFKTKCNDVNRNIHPIADNIYETIKNACIDKNAVFLGDYAMSQYSQYIQPHNLRNYFKPVADIDVLSEEPEEIIERIKEMLNNEGIQNIKVLKHDALGELVPMSYQILVNNDTCAYIYKPFRCHNYNVIDVNHQHVNIATIDTILSFYLAFLYINKPQYDTERLMCMCKILVDVYNQSNLANNGVLKRFELPCIGPQHTLSDMKKEKNSKFIELKGKKGTKEYDMYFLNYNPGQQQEKEINSHVVQIKPRTRTPSRSTSNKTPFSKRVLRTKRRRVASRNKTYKHKARKLSFFGKRL